MNDSQQHAARPHFVITAEGSLHGEDTPENRELVRRIHACVNACEGISTEELEKGIIRDMCHVLQQVVPLLQKQEALNPQPSAERTLVVDGARADL